MAISRRRFLGNGLGFVSLSMAMPTFLAQAARAATPTGPNGSKILVVLELSGGNDALNMVVPFADPMYRKLRPSIGIKEADALGLGGKLGLHPAMGQLKAMFDKGRVSVLPGVGYPNPNRSHFESMDIWQSGDPTRNPDRSGWLARGLDAQGHPMGQHSLGGVALGGSLPLALWTQQSALPVIGRGDDFGFNGGMLDRDGAKDALQKMYAGGTVANGHQEFVRAAGAGVFEDSETIRNAIKKYDYKAGAAAQYPDSDLSRSLQTVSKLITGGAPTRVYYLNMGGYDTHANQPGSHQYLLGTLSDATAAFLRDIELQGRMNDVMLMTFSEFGRRVQENASSGTDHGAAGSMFVMGGKVRGGVAGTHPDLADLDDGDLKFTQDFRAVYSTVLQGWLGVAPKQVIPGDWKALSFV